MTLDQKINTIIRKYKTCLHGSREPQLIESWAGTPSYRPWSIDKIGNPSYKDKILYFLMIDMLIYNAKKQECANSRSEYVRLIKVHWMSTHDFQVEWVKRYNKHGIDL